MFNPEDIDDLDISNLEEEAAKELATIDFTTSPQAQPVSPDDDNNKTSTVLPQLDGIISPDLAIIESGLSHDVSGGEDNFAGAATRRTVLSQLDGAVSSDEDELMIDLGDNHAPGGGNKESSKQVCFHILFSYQFIYFYNHSGFSFSHPVLNYVIVFL